MSHDLEIPLAHEEPSPGLAPCSPVPSPGHQARLPGHADSAIINKSSPPVLITLQQQAAAPFDAVPIKAASTHAVPVKAASNDAAAVPSKAATKDQDSELRETDGTALCEGQSASLAAADTPCKPAPAAPIEGSMCDMQGSGDQRSGSLVALSVQMSHDKPGCESQSPGTANHNLCYEVHPLHSPKAKGVPSAMLPAGKPPVSPAATAAAAAINTQADPGQPPIVCAAAAAATSRHAGTLISLAASLGLEHAANLPALQPGAGLAELPSLPSSRPDHPGIMTASPTPPPQSSDGEERHPMHPANGHSAAGQQPQRRTRRLPPPIIVPGAIHAAMRADPSLWVAGQEGVTHAEANESGSEQGSASQHTRGGWRGRLCGAIRSHPRVACLLAAGAGVAVALLAGPHMSQRPPTRRTQ